VKQFIEKIFLPPGRKLVLPDQAGKRKELLSEIIFPRLQRNILLLHLGFALEPLAGLA
jgi:hypothetical protein